jgi:hypothetical protein
MRVVVKELTSENVETRQEPGWLTEMPLRWSRGQEVGAAGVAPSSKDDVARALSLVL